MVDGLYGTIHTPYAVFSDDMYDGITEVKKQVKDTTMILNSIASGDNVCASADYQKNRGKILDTGISLYRNDVSCSRERDHKTIKRRF